MIIILYQLLYFLIFSSYFTEVYSVNIVNSEDEFLESISGKVNEITIKGRINIKSTETLSFKSTDITISGDDKKVSIIHFLNTDKVNLLFPKECKFIKFYDISIIGNIHFTDNTNILFKNVYYNGYFISEHTYKDETSNIEINNSDFYLSEINQGYEIYNWNLVIKNSNFYGNNIYDTFLLKFKGEPQNTLNIDSSYFNGNYHNSGLYCYYGLLNVSYSAFHNFFSGKQLNGGGAMTLKYTNNTLENLDFKNNFSETYGGSIYFIHAHNTIFNHSQFTNTTSSLYGGAFYVLGGDSKNIIFTSKNITQTGFCDSSNFNTEGTFFGAYGLSDIEVNEYKGNNICTGSLLSVEGDAKVTLKYSEVENVYSKNDGPIVKITNPINDGAKVDILKCNFKNIFQNNDSYSAMIAYVIGGLLYFEGSNFSNLKGVKSGLIINENKGRVRISSVEISDVYSKFSEPLIYSSYSEENTITGIKFHL